ncbi:MAG: hypothetical protein SVZ03_15350 [Spirochaetota bacterium]|nr:hypothetical protein [Spirochaetota bacterium]
MKSIVEMIIHVKRGFLAHLTNEIYKRGYEIQRVMKLESQRDRDMFHFEITYHNDEKFNGLIDKIKKHENNFEIVSIYNPIEDRLVGGSLKVSGKFSIENSFDYDIKISGALDLILKRIDEREDGIIYTGLSKNIGLISGLFPQLDCMKGLLRTQVINEMDSVIINRFSGLNAYPVTINYTHIDDFIKILKGIESTFSAIRITYIDGQDDISLYDRIISETSLPVLTKYYDEIPLYLLITILHLYKKHKVDIKESNVGVIGINISSLRLTSLLIDLGFSRILGNDINERMMFSFEKEGGLATTRENIFSNSDLIIIFKNHIDTQDMEKFGPGQIVISLVDDDIDKSILVERGVKEFLNGNWMNLSILFPGILKGLIKSDIDHLNNTRLINLSNMISDREFAEEIAPDLFTDIHEKISGFVQKLS